MEYMHIEDVKLLAMNAHRDEEARRELFAAALEGKGRSSANALWALTHLPKGDVVYLDEHRGGLVALALTASDVSRRRLALALLERLEWTVDQVDTALLDFCLAHLMDPSEAVGVRALCAKLGYQLCRHYPELLEELRQSLLMLDPALLKPGLKHTRNRLLGELQSGRVTEWQCGKVATRSDVSVTQRLSDSATQPLNTLMSLRDEKYAAFTAKLIPNIDPSRVIGVRAPEIARLAKELRGTAEAQRFMNDLPHFFLEENDLHAALLNGGKDYATVVEEVDRFLPYVDNWATCDSLSPKVFARHTEELLSEVRRWMASEQEYTCRFGIGMLMRYYLEPGTFSPEQLEWVAAIRREEYYVQMMQAWFFATALAKQWSAAEPYMHEGRLPEWVRRKSIQKAIESFRVPDAHKAHLRGLRTNSDVPSTI